MLNYYIQEETIQRKTNIEEKDVVLDDDISEITIDTNFDIVGDNLIVHETVFSPSNDNDEDQKLKSIDDFDVFVANWESKEKETSTSKTTLDLLDLDIESLTDIFE